MPEEHSILRKNTNSRTQKSRKTQHVDCCLLAWDIKQRWRSWREFSSSKTTKSMKTACKRYKDKSSITLRSRLIMKIQSRRWSCRMRSLSCSRRKLISWSRLGRLLDRLTKTNLLNWISMVWPASRQLDMSCQDWKGILKCMSLILSTVVLKMMIWKRSHTGSLKTAASKHSNLERISSALLSHWFNCSNKKANNSDH